ncbi:hypothetical protein HZB01_00925 [Candidatus Woesearchaeota archaeon]|nr:hypothetical protein [Candidatus Woesearchaeota archaeon]
MTTETIIFAGHFNLGERLVPEQLQTVADAKTYLAEGTDLGILVGDIGFAQSLEAYLKQGIEGVKEIYTRRLKNAMACGAGCVISQLPRTDKLLEVIDEAHYMRAVQMLVENYGASKELTIEQITNTVRETIAPQLIQSTLEVYGLKPEEVKLYSERELRNIVARRLGSQKEDQKESWRTMLKQITDPFLYAIFRTEVEKDRGRAGCRGIMLALYEQLAMQGYEKIVELYPAKHKLSILNAQEVYAHLGRLFPEDKRWKLNFENRFY